jgi:hypothetical protein
MHLRVRIHRPHLPRPHFHLAQLTSKRSRGPLALTLAVLVLAGMTVSLAASGSRAVRQGTTWYVSRHGDGTVGTSWATAWTELSKIDWSVINPGDRIVIDGGATPCRSNYPLGATNIAPPGKDCGMVYRTPLVVHDSGRGGEPITIALSKSPKHDGTAILFGGRSTPLPYCDQKQYSAVGQARSAGITIPGHSHIVIDGTHRSGIMVYGAKTGVDLHSDRTSYVTLRNLELFDNGTYGRWAHGYMTDGEGISLAGRNIVIDRDLIHDNGQDAIQDTDTGVANTGHRPMANISVTNSWLYERREHPIFRGYGFNSGSQEVAAQDCTHVDGLQVWGGGLRQHAMNFGHDIFGPYLAQGVYPGDDNVASFDDVRVTNSLFLNVLDHSIIGAHIASDHSTPHGWRLSNDTSYMTDRPPPGLDTHGSVDLAGTGHTVTNSLFYNGYFYAPGIKNAHGNIWWRGDPVPGARHRQPKFKGSLPAGNAPSYYTLAELNLTPTCGACAGVGSSLHNVRDLMRRIDSLDGGPAK